jgi:SAM-dependent methyltransferase
MTLPQSLLPGPIQRTCSDLILEGFNSLDSWKDWRTKNVWIFDAEYIDTVIAHAQREGVRSLWFGDLPPNAVRTIGEGISRSISAPMWIFERHRMLLDLIVSMPLTANTNKVRIYAAEAQSAWALAMRSRYPRFLGSEYRPEPGGEQVLWPIQSQDVTRLTYPDGCFDLAVTQEVLEHVSDLPAAMRELGRILRIGGVMLSTFPFKWESQDTEVRSRVVDGKVEHLEAPEYHSDPQRPEDGALVFQTPGWDILNLATKCGFSNADFILYSTKMGAVRGPHLAGLWCLVCQR